MDENTANSDRDDAVSPTVAGAARVSLPTAATAPSSPFATRGADEIWGSAMQTPNGSEWKSEEEVRRPLIRRLEGQAHSPCHCPRCREVEEYLHHRGACTETDGSLGGVEAESTNCETAGLAALTSTKKKRKRKKKGKSAKRSKTRPKHERSNNKKAEGKKGGSRLIMNKSAPAVQGDGRNNNRTCLLDAILPYIRDAKVKAEIKSSFLADMPAEGDTSVSMANTILAKHNMVLRRASKRYNRGGSIAFQLLQEHSCSLIVHLRLYSLEDTSLFASNFVAWDGKEVHDHPRSVRVNNSSDRTQTNYQKIILMMVVNSHIFM